MIEIITVTAIYTATLLSCYDGDTCKIKLYNVPTIVEEITLRFEGFDTPEIKGQCIEEKIKAKKAKEITTQYMETYQKIYTEGNKGKYGRLLVSAPVLREQLINQGLANPYDGGTRESWCQ